MASMQDSTSEFVQHVPCENCGSSDANSLYSDGHSYCFSCDHFIPGDGQDITARPRSRAEGTLTMAECEGAYMPLKARGISQNICRKFGYWIGKHKGQTYQIADYRDSSGALIGQKLRDRDKNFTAKGKVSNTVLWGSHLWPSKGKAIVITEGEIDALSVAQMQEGKWPVVSLPCGAKAARKTLAANYEFLDGYEKIILMFDQDEAGVLAIQEAAEVLPPGKVHIAHLPLKDANECLVEGQGQAIIKAIFDATPYRPDGIIRAADLIQSLLTKKDDVRIPFPLGEGLNKKTLGMGEGELIMLTSGSGMGKSSFAREIAYAMGHLSGYKVGLAFLEESMEDTLKDIAGLHLKKRIRQYPDSATQEEKAQAYNTLYNNDTYFLYDFFGSPQEDALINKLRYMATVEECKVIILDHLSIVVSGLESDDGDERKTLDRLMTKLKTLAKSLGIILIVVSHLRRKGGKEASHEEGGQVSLSELRGSGGIAQLSDTVIGFERNQQGDTPNEVTVRILKCRFTGDTGIADTLIYDIFTGRMVQWGSNNAPQIPNDDPEEDDPF